MGTISGGWARLRRIVGMPVEDEVESELGFHLEMRVRDLVEGGMDPRAARAAAVRSFGDPREIARECRTIAHRRNRKMRTREWLGELRQDVAYGVRQLARNPGFAAVAALTLALGIGANTAVFSAVNGVMLRPLPFADPDRLVMLWEENPEKGWHMQKAAPANVLDWREQVPAFQDVAAYLDFSNRVTLSGVDEPRVLSGAVVTGNFFSVLGVRPQLGRALRDEETWSGPEPVAVLSHRAWVEHFAGDPGVVGRSVRLNGNPYRIVGAMPEGFSYPLDDVDVWTPTAWDPADRTQAWFRRAHFVRPIARLRPGVSPREADAQLQAVARRLQAEHPETNRLMDAGMTPLHRFLVGDARVPLLVLLGAVGLLLLLACANVGNLLLVRATARQRELAVRGALGASRGRLLRQMAVESLVLSAAGGILGLALGWLGTRALDALRPPELLREGQLALDGRVLAFGVGITLASGILFGLAPALWSSRTRLAEGLRTGSARAGGSGRGARRAAGALAALEVALALLLVVGAGLLVRSYGRLQRVDPGFEARGVLTASLQLSGSGYDSGEKVAAFFEQLVQRVEGLPGVQDAAMVRQLPLTADWWTSDFAVAGRGADDYGVELNHRWVTPNYFRTMRVPLLRGRDFTAADRPDSPPVVVVNEALARQHFPDRDPIGQRIAFDRVPDGESTWYTIVGVVGGERQGSMTAAPRIEVFQSVTQDPAAGMHLVVRTGGDPTTVVPALRRVVAELDPSLALDRVQTAEQLQARSVARERFLTALLGLFAGVALLLAMVGVYGVIAQATRQRTREMGVRLALGSPRSAVVALVVRHGLVLVALGVAVGLPLALLAARAMNALLFEVAPTDPLVHGGVALLLMLVGAVAALIPALRVSRTDPGAVLQAD